MCAIRFSTWFRVMIVDKTCIKSETRFLLGIQDRDEPIASKSMDELFDRDVTSRQSETNDLYQELNGETRLTFKELFERELSERRQQIKSEPPSFLNAYTGDSQWSEMYVEINVDEIQARECRKSWLVDREEEYQAVMHRFEYRVNHAQVVGEMQEMAMIPPGCVDLPIFANGGQRYRAALGEFESHM